MAAKFPAQIETERERVRLGRVRKAFAAGLEKAAQGEKVPLEFFAAAVDYIKASMDRLHAQDQRIHDLLKARVAASDTTVGAALDSLNQRLATSRAALLELAAARDVFRAAGDGGFAAFQSAVAKFMDIYFNVLLKSHHSTTDIQEKLFTETDWNAVAGLSNDALQREATLFAQVQKYAPAGADPAAMTGGPPPRATAA